MKKLLNFNQNDWDRIIIILCGICAVICQTVLVAITIGKDTVSTQSYVLQCYNCIVWIFMATFLSLFSKGE